ncbi:MAG: transcription antitermination factor NusB [Flavobacteriales bacterium AspAUS03]
MSVRRRFRVRAMQFLYAQYISGLDCNIVERNMLQSIDKIYDLYICLLNLVLSFRNRALQKIEAEKERKFVIFGNFSSNRKFADNALLEILSKNVYLSDYSAKNQQLTWQEYMSYVILLFEELQHWPYYKEYVIQEESSFEEDKDFILKCYETHIKPHKKLREWFEDQYITWVDDLEIAHSMTYDTLKFIKATTPVHFRLYSIYKDKEDKIFIITLYRKTISHCENFNELIRSVATNWDLDRMAILDKIVLQMALCEFLYFPTIPPKVTMNEYIEITKIYSTSKSKIFINGILDQLFKVLNKQEKILKIGKGLM